MMPFGVKARGHIPPKPGFGGQVSNPMGARLPPAGGELTPTGGRKATMGSGGSGGVQASPFGNTQPRPSVSTHKVPNKGQGKQTASPLKKVKTGPKGGDGKAGMKSYQHVPFKRGFKNLGKADHSNLHPSVRPPTASQTLFVGDKATGKAAGTKAMLPKKSPKGVPGSFRTK